MFPRGVTIFLTNSCFLNCSHCSIVNNCKPSFINYFILEDVLKILKNNKVYMIAFTGGDPLMHPDIFKILKKTREFGMLPLLGISGVNLTDEYITNISKSGVGCVQISIDGITDEINSIFRGPGTLAEILKNVEKMQKYGIKVNVAICISKVNIVQYKEIINEMYKLNVYKLKVQFYKNNNQYNNVHSEISLEEKEEIIEFCLDFQKKNLIEEWIQCEGTSTELLDIYKKRLTIMSNGDVKHNEFGRPLGNIYLNKLEDIYNEK